MGKFDELPIFLGVSNIAMGNQISVVCKVSILPQLVKHFDNLAKQTQIFDAS